MCSRQCWTCCLTSRCYMYHIPQFQPNHHWLGARLKCLGCGAQGPIRLPRRNSRSELGLKLKGTMRKWESWSLNVMDLTINNHHKCDLQRFNLRPTNWEASTPKRQVFSFLNSRQIAEARTKTLNPPTARFGASETLKLASRYLWISKVMKCEQMLKSRMVFQNT